mgnify:FL=1
MIKQNLNIRMCANTAEFFVNATFFTQKNSFFVALKIY